LAFRGLGDELGIDRGAQHAQRAPSRALLGDSVCLGVELGEPRGSQARGSQLPDREPRHGQSDLDLIEPDLKGPVDPDSHIR
jgi:hypothetical protein